MIRRPVLSALLLAAWFAAVVLLLANWKA